MTKTDALSARFDTNLTSRFLAARVSGSTSSRLRRCDQCEGTGRLQLDGERTMICNDGCIDGYHEVDLDGCCARYLWLEGVVVYEKINDTYTLETDDGMTVINLTADVLDLI